MMPPSPLCLWYSHTVKNILLVLLKLYVPELEHGERQFLEATICCLSSLDGALLESGILRTSKAMRNAFHHLILIEIVSLNSLFFDIINYFVIFEVGILQYTLKRGLCL